MSAEPLFKCDHSDDPDFPKSFEFLQTTSPTNPHAKNLLGKEITTQHKLVFFQQVIDLVRYVLCWTPSSDSGKQTAYEELFGSEPELNPFKNLLFDEKISLLSGVREYIKEHPDSVQLDHSVVVEDSSLYEQELYDKPNEDVSKNFAKLNIHTNLKDGKHSSESFLQNVKKNVFGLSAEEYLLLRKSVHLCNTGIYLFIRGWDPQCTTGTPQRVAKLIVDNMAWRWIYTPELTKWDDIVESAKYGSLYDYGFDLEGNPMLYMIVGRENLKTKMDDRALMLRFRHLCLCFEHMVDRLYDGSSQNYLGKDEKDHLGQAPFQITWVVDIKDSSINIDLVKKIKFIFDLLGFYYPERSELVFVMNVPWYGKMLWAVISQFLTQRQRDQYQFLSDPYISRLTKSIDPKFISSDLNISGIGAGTDSTYTFNIRNRMKKYSGERVVKWI
ncbi:hypothetical protein C9374_010544 [Naegleria lovaniensis]|uniref:CRAL-TRIO domain-containing protein n=1 Tax=Naegleria lovaniensis TaxID=51637 RepID=A0AA88GG11_NAELO|nr:uncharacterized protein C9374_010544 [Naegleria lovaniensis]KAG2374800.1 hypothetical protein C9374_010544 [Naegleria lovaniensis]